MPTSEKGVYEVVAKPEDIPRVKVTEGHGTDAEVQVRAWRRETILGAWTVGTVEKLGFEGFKSNDLSRLRVRAEQERREKAKAKAK